MPLTNNNINNKINKNTFASNTLLTNKDTKMENSSNNNEQRLTF